LIFLGLLVPPLEIIDYSFSSLIIEIFLEELTFLILLLLLLLGDDLALFLLAESFGEIDSY